MTENETPIKKTRYLNRELSQHAHSIYQALCKTPMTDRKVAMLDITGASLLLPYLSEGSQGFYNAHGVLPWREWNRGLDVLIIEESQHAN